METENYAENKCSGNSRMKRLTIITLAYLLALASHADRWGTFDDAYFAQTSAGATATGGTITTNGGYIIHTFTNVGTSNFVVSGGSLVCDVLVVAGGGGGAHGWEGGGGGAGGMLILPAITVSGTSVVVVGVGGAGGPAEGTAGKNGTNSSFGTNIATGGGHGGQWDITVAGNGGSGGGMCRTLTVGTGIEGQGHNGGNGGSVANMAGGGGGAGEAGHNALSTVTGAQGGDGLQCSYSGATNYYAGGGGGALSSNAPPGGAGGGGAGGTQFPSVGGTAAIPNTGGGGGGNRMIDAVGGTGGSGIVIVRYLQ